MNFRTLLFSCTLATFSSVAFEQEVLLTTDFVLKAGASEIRTLSIQKPEHLDQLVMIGFNPVRALAVDCVVRLYTGSDVLLGSYNCAEQQNHSLAQSLPDTTQFKAQIEVSNNNFTQATTRFSVINRFKFVSIAR